MKCPFCYIRQKPGVLDFKLASEKITTLNPEKIIYHGGEPLLYPNLILEFINTFPKIQQSITTNLTLEFNESIRKVLEKCQVATSFDATRFQNSKDLQVWINNFRTLRDSGKEITILVTITKETMEKYTPVLLSKILLKLNPAYITLERLFDSSKSEDFYQQVDSYMLEVFKELPKEKNTLLMSMENAIRNKSTVFCTNCSENIITLNPNLTETGCPNLYQSKSIEKSRNCLYCKYYLHCQGDCQSFKYTCAFPKETFSYVKGRINE